MGGDVLNGMARPRIWHLGDGLHAVCFPLMKLLPALRILDHAERVGLVTPETTIVETTSGTFGLGLAMASAARGHRLVLVSDPVVEGSVRHRLEALGATVEVVTEPAARGGLQAARLARVHEIAAACPSYVPRQYDNPQNPAAYAEVGDQIEEQLGSIDCLVGAVGSGGSVCGTSRALRQRAPGLTVLGVDTHNSVLFGLADGPRELRGLGNSVLPGNLDHTVFDEVHWVGAADAASAAKSLYVEHRLYMGLTSGAAYLAARWWAARHPGHRVVVLMPDDAYRYEDTLLRAPVLSPDLKPRLVAKLHDVEAPHWTTMKWHRRGV